ncbi:MAG TPA: AAA family ATPase [Gemmataceae bacterium]|jgi:hypothetical protein|nr:AAA family ATPase [Gemmataceae bacterium]
MTDWTLERASDIRPTTLDWLWPGYLVRSKLALLDGDPEMGKSLLTIDIAARLSLGVPMPDGAPVDRPGTTILISAEDGAADTIRPRADAAGADLDRIILPGFGDRLPVLPDHIAKLEEMIRTVGADLLVLDPLMAFLPPRVAANVDQCVRQALTPLTNLAARTGCTILLVRHLAKRNDDRAAHRGVGSMGILAAVRSALFVAPHPSDYTLNVLSASKLNVGRRPPSLGYRVVAQPASPATIEWTGPIDLTADDLCRPPKSTECKIRDRAIDWLKCELAAGPRKAADIYAAAALAGIPERTLQRAKSNMPAKSHRVWDQKTERGEWYWYDSDVPWPKNAPFKKPYEFPPVEGPW